VRFRRSEVTFCQLKLMFCTFFLDSVIPASSGYSLNVNFTLSLMIRWMGIKLSDELVTFILHLSIVQHRQNKDLYPIVNAFIPSAGCSLPFYSGNDKRRLLKVWICRANRCWKYIDGSALVMQLKRCFDRRYKAAGFVIVKEPFVFGYWN
jgi:hypothetical protein